MSKNSKKSFSVESDELSGKAYDSQLMKRLVLYLKPYRLQVALAVFLLLIIAATRLVGPYLTKIAIDRYIIEEVDLDGLGYISILFVGFLFIQFFITFIHTYLMQWIGQKVMYDLRTQLFAHIQTLSLRFFDRNPVGRLVTRVTNDVDVLNEVLTSGLVAIFGDIFTLVGIVIVMLSLNWKLALVTFCVLPMLFYVTFVFRSRVRESFRNVRKRLARINTFLQENISGMYIVQLFSREKTNYNRFEGLNKDHLQAHLNTIFYFALFFPTVEFVGYLAIAVTLAYGGWQIQASGLTLGVLIAFIQYAQNFFRPISDLSEKYNILQGAMAASERIFKLLDEKPDILTKSQPKALSEDHSKIEFCDVSFGYNVDHFVLKDISFEIKKGQKIALVGATGSGKTSIINLLTRFYDVQKGQILIDGVDLRDVSVEEWRKRIAIVQQDIFIFSGTIADNIRLGENFSEEQINSAAKNVAANEFIRRLPQKYDTDVRERGNLISMGQRQLLAFARALAFDPEILILDEATASVDPHTEELIQQALEKLLENRTSIVIAHRLSTIKHADLILVLHKGRIREQGTHDELLQMGGIYQKLYQIQIDSHSELVAT